jgi:hypothetical protein
MKQALKLKAGRENIKIRAVALNEEELVKFAESSDVNVVTPYHGLTNLSKSKWGYNAPFEDVNRYYKSVLKRSPQKALEQTKKAYPELDLVLRKNKQKGYDLKIRKAYPYDPAVGKFRHNKLFKIIVEQNPQIIERIGYKKLLKYTDTWQNMPPSGSVAKKYHKKYAGKMCCVGGKCSKDRMTKCGYQTPALIIPGVFLPDGDDEE